VRLREGDDAESVERKFPALISKYRSSEDAKKINYQLQPIKDVYLHSRNILERDGIATKGDYSYTMGLSGIAVLIMFIACFNFANISTALSLYRLKEIGIKRTLGSSQSQIFSQLIFESTLHAAVSLLLGLIILQIGITKLENLLDTDWQLTMTTHLKSLPIYIILILGVGFIGALYPAIFLSGMKPQLALKAKNTFRQGTAVRLKKQSLYFSFLSLPY
jgi:putative ABC transport system permease protein